ncbi:HAD family hydrolase [Cobetia marina]|jgi:3-deoxy-D-manno-octulosonate 8-phosphate phosphatase (KDO 8-P phosphatase)|uniref:KdsC family phosphatase n=1 Tax=Cobetia TaxID=204286 RepID=UPI0009846318|nr:MULTISPECIES: HAD hydrolase family protein [Cobetia]MDA5563611.1 HAD hydrolase family protein [Cobetia sp. MMG027]MDH2290703.1 HAD hydrolase family protein [Cobetia sp. 10Alg 146]MDN2654875.1 HAD hydrolase family protein [Cobetia sp. 14N.309.X.WAT.E.A4]POR08261.1 HAD family hydrolase [Cobetia sp. MM1IDA2H-1]TKD64722.1 HAD family hydrolase [Cobetia marina]
MNDITSLAEDYPQDIIDRSRRVRLLALDVDGVLTDNRLHYDANGVETKSFHVQDGHGLKLILRSGIRVALITGRSSPMVERRAKELGIQDVIQGREDKLVALTNLCREHDIALDDVAYCGDDLPDREAIRRVGLGVSVPNAMPYVMSEANWVTTRQGGDGAVREICDLLLKAQGHWASVLDTYLQESRA